jgi:heme exporter protein C
MTKVFTPLAFVVMALFAVAPLVVAYAPFEQTMGLVQKVFYYHVPSAMLMFMSACVAGVASAVYLFTRSAAADRLALAAGELVVLFGAIVLVTGPLWARKAWGRWWVWDARLTTTLLLWLIFLAFLLVRRYGGPGSRTLAAGLAVFGMLDVPIIWVAVSLWRTQHPKTTYVPSLGPAARLAFFTSLALFTVLWAGLFWVRLAHERNRSRLDELFVAAAEAGVEE